MLEGPAFLPPKPSSTEAFQNTNSKIHGFQGSNGKSQENPDGMKHNRNQECERDGSQKSIWKADLRGEGSAWLIGWTGRRSGPGGDARGSRPPRPVGVSKAAAVAGVGAQVQGQ